MNFILSGGSKMAPQAKASANANISGQNKSETSATLVKNKNEEYTKSLKSVLYLGFSSVSLHLSLKDA